MKMRAVHFELLVEEPSMEAFLENILPRVIGRRPTFNIHAHQGKPDLLKKLRSQLRAYANWLPPDWRIVVLVDCDARDCITLKETLEREAHDAGLTTRTAAIDTCWRVVNRIAVEELEAWFFGHWEGVRAAYPRVSASIPNQASYRHCDRIAGGTWEALERILNRAGYFIGGLRKVEAALKISEHFDHKTCASPSFIAFRDALTEAV